MLINGVEVSAVQGSRTIPLSLGANTITDDGPFAFALALLDGDSYDVIITSQPAGQTWETEKGPDTFNAGITE